MKKAFIGLLILILSAWAQYVFSAEPIQLARMNGYVAAGVGAASCTTDNDGKIWEPTTQNGGGSSSVTWVASKITISANSTITMYKSKETDDAATGNIKMLLMNHDAVNDQPDETSIVANSTITKNNGDIPGTPTVNEYVLPSTFNLTVGTYWLVSQEENGMARGQFFSSSSGNRACYSNNSGSTWTCTADYSYDMEVWGCAQ